MGARSQATRTSTGMGKQYTVELSKAAVAPNQNKAAFWKDSALWVGLCRQAGLWRGTLWS